ncbi:hypothetical protein CAPTEDRAFT_205407 [Capitella teleta]|uniref:Alpha-macroglobulin receptor-binding domain-containing protein n=1 Tax=Capitella teleta TaxID=283909 RepID=R7TTW7_CAPTE|nr:hypothetical protein CAPTEDRAFT_205407 [Capitella teleta]|eukprot:ELT94901.1 hypothetical protein CAPTEDRAFT_205407 [Capitella teleta]
MLHDSDEYRFVAVEDFGIVSSYNPRTLRGDIQTMVYLEKGSVTEIHIPIIPVVDGCITIRLVANTFIYGDKEEMELCTKYDGVTNFLHTPYVIDLINSGSLVLPDLEIPVPERFVKPQERQHLYVPGSPECHVGIVGDIVGPGFFEDYLDAENTLRKPFGSAEQNMYNFAYNLYNLKYLKATNQLKPERLQASLKHLNLALQRQLGYMNDDGSFSMFRDYQEPTPSTWVSAFVLRILHEANDRDWELDFFIETDLLNRIGVFLCTRQNINTGAFMEAAPLYDRKMWSNHTTINNQDHQSNFSLTAYVLASFMLADRLTGQADICKNDVTQKAQNYLELHLNDITDVYELAITTYALTLAGSSESTKAFYLLQDKRIESDYVYWANKVIPPNDIKTVDTIPYYQPRRWYDNEAYGVEATAYAMLTYLRKNMISDTQPIMKWLQTMRNTYAAQASTQDSIMALIALVEYAKLDTNRALYNIEVTVEATSMGNFSTSVSLDSSNWPDQQHVDVFPVWGSSRGRAQGTGMALMQMATSVNVEYENQILPAAEGKYFDIHIEHFNFTGRNFSIIEITPCAMWSRGDISPRSGLAVIELHVPTGYVVTNDVLRAYAQSGEVPTLRRAETYDRKVVFYFDYLEADKATCVKVRLDRWFPVANMTIQHTLKVYDYYEPGMHNTTLYNTWFLFNLHICQVCGSFQCPFCRYYNAGPAVTAPHVPTLLLSSLLLCCATLRRWV